MKWYEVEESRRTPEQNLQAQQAYLRALFGTEEGREFLCDMQNRAAKDILGAQSDSEEKAAFWIYMFVEGLATRAGVVKRMDVIKAQAEIARRYEPPTPESQLPEGYME